VPCLEFGGLLAPSVNLKLLRIHLTVARKRLRSISLQLPDVFPQKSRTNPLVACRLRRRDLGIPYQLNRLKLELEAVLLSPHAKPRFRWKHSI
jgi:hypothetical protein